LTTHALEEPWVEEEEVPMALKRPNAIGSSEEMSRLSLHI
jgi:hypothetical protein